jgi:hypothetical protein
VSGASTRVLVIFPEPLYDVNVRYGGIYDSGANYAIISATNLCVLTGKKYKHLRSVKSKPNPLVLSTDAENVKSITEATLVSPSNIDNVLEKCYNWLIRTNKLSTRIAERKHNNGTVDARVGLGDKITVPTEYGGGYESIDGRVVKSSFGLNGSILIKDVEVV